MAKKYTVGEKVLVYVGEDQADYPPYKSFLPYHGKTGVVTAIPGSGSEAPRAYEVRLNMGGNVILTVPQDVLVATER